MAEPAADSHPMNFPGSAANQPPRASSFPPIMAKKPVTADQADAAHPGREVKNPRTAVYAFAVQEIRCPIQTMVAVTHTIRSLKKIRDSGPASAMTEKNSPRPSPSNPRLGAN